MKKEIFAYLATYLEEYKHSDLAGQIRHHVIPGKQTGPALRRYERVQAEVIIQLRTLAMLSPSELSDEVLKRRGYE